MTDAPYTVVADTDLVNWSEDLEALHEESSRDHFIDVWTRRATMAGLGPSVPEDAYIADLGCSTGYLLEDLRRRWPRARLAGVDLVAAGLRKAHELVPDAELYLADVCALPFDDSSLDAVVSANLLEHVPDDAGALREIARVLKPGARASLVVPAGPGLYDYYDRFLGHERRYARGELAGKARAAGLEVLSDAHLGSLLYPAFWAVKKRNRRLNLDEAEIQARVAKDIGTTQGSRLGALACTAERGLLQRGVRLPFGVRGYTVVRKPGP
jgi:SAM-dependent methyltransferase